MEMFFCCYRSSGVHFWGVMWHPFWGDLTIYIYDISPYKIYLSSIFDGIYDIFEYF